MDFTGQFLQYGAPGFEHAALSRIFNHRRPRRRPAAVLCATGVADVAAGVRLARSNGWQVAVRSGGHSWAAWSLREHTLLLDLACLDGISYDAATGIVTTGPAVRGGSELDPFLAAHDRFFPGGHCPTVGLGGFLLQGGMGWNCRGWGWAAELLEAVDVVTADGALVRASATEHEDLFWAARGAGPAFPGVVTAFHLRTLPRYRDLTQTTYVYPCEVAEDVLRWIHVARHDVPDSVELVVVGRDSVLVVDGVSFDGGAAALAPLDSCPVAGKALLRKIAAPVAIEDLRAEQIRANPARHRYTVDNAYLAGATDELIPAMTPAFTDLPTAKSFSLWFDLAHLPGREQPDMAVSLSTDIYFASYLVGESATDDAACRSWTDATMRRLEPFSPGCYLGDSDLSVRPVPFMSDQAWDRLRRIRAARDPGQLFPGYD